MWKIILCDVERSLLNPFININVAWNYCLLTLKGFWIYRLTHDTFRKSFWVENCFERIWHVSYLLVRRKCSELYEVLTIYLLNLPINIFFLENIYFNSSVLYKNFHISFFNINSISLERGHLKFSRTICRFGLVSLKSIPGYLSL